VPGSIEIDGSGDPLSGSCLLWTGAANGTVLSYFDTLLASVRGININGGGIAGVTGVLFDADNAPISKYPSLGGFRRLCVRRPRHEWLRCPHRR